MKLKRRSDHLSYCHILIYIISHLWSGIASLSVPGYSINVTERITVQRGLCVHIQCSFTVPKGLTLSRNTKGIWYNKDGKTVASKKNTESEKNYRFLLTGNIQSGNCSLYIEDPLSEDEGNYFFRVEDKKIKYSYKDIQPYVKVTDKPEISPIKSWLDGEEVKMECTFTDTCKKTDPEIIWERNIQEASVTPTQTTYHENGLKTHQSIITFIARKEQHGSPLSCILQLTQEVTAVRDITLNVEYPPSVDITIDGSSPDANSPIIMIEGQTKSLECNVDSNPVAEITWFHEDRQLPVINQTYKLKNISLNYAGRYNCKASNHHGTAEKNISISVCYHPRTPEITCFVTSKDLNDSDCTMKDNNTIYALEGSPLSLTCSADSEPVSNLTWMSSNESEMASPMDTLVLTNLSFADEGPYSCQATNAYGTLRTSVNVQIMYRPRIVNGRNSSCWKVDENHLACTCLIESLPKPTVKWKINGRFINVSNHMNGKVSIFTERSNSVTNSTLYLPVNTEESQNIQCVASNKHGELVLELFNETAQSASKAFPAAVIYGGCVAVVLIVIGILLIIFCRKGPMK
ncbi:sialic acid-binding Ig-like lectin 12 isoform X2 [Rana temporaria]|uniref:sialic acid-binding Ig-like lectin 12 isoform X2 n=1 Tax=Rana temporaria TaxID=8407 RepID=UPI001AADEF80|nr:sialic acid-binding Ig-like lectin 12 isoform X2 [Rana temporaria]